VRRIGRTLALLLASAVAVAGCADMMGGADSTPGDSDAERASADAHGSLQLSFGFGQETSGSLRASLTDPVEPGIDLEGELSELIVSGQGPMEQDFEEDPIDVAELGNGAGEVEIPGLVIGIWTITVEGVDDGGEPIGRGTTTVSIVPEQTVSAQITVRPVDGYGTLQLDISYPVEGILEGYRDLELTGQLGVPDSGEEPFELADEFESHSNGDVVEAELSQEYPAGMYTLALQLRAIPEGAETGESETLWGVATAAQIVNGETSNAGTQITVEDIFGDGDLELSVETALDVRPERLDFQSADDGFDSNAGLLQISEGLAAEEITVDPGSESAEVSWWFLNGELQRSVERPMGSTEFALQGFGDTLPSRRYTLSVNIHDERRVHYGSLDVQVVPPEVAVADTSNQRIVLLDELTTDTWREIDMTTLEHPDGEGTIDATHPLSVTWAGYGRLAVVARATDFDPETILIMSTRGEVDRVHEVGNVFVEHAVGYASGPDSLFYLTDQERLYRWEIGDPEDEPIEVASAGEISVWQHTRGLGVDSDGYVYLVEGLEPPRIIKLDPTVDDPPREPLAEFDPWVDFGSWFEQEVTVGAPIDLRYDAGTLYALSADPIHDDEGEGLVFALDAENLDFDGEYFGRPVDDEQNPQENEFFGPERFAAVEPGRHVLVDLQATFEGQHRVAGFDDMEGSGWQTLGGERGDGEGQFDFAPPPAS